MVTYRTKAKYITATMDSRRRVIVWGLQKKSKEMSSTGRSFIVTKVSEIVRAFAGDFCPGNVDVAHNLGESSVLVEIPSPFSGELSFDRFFITFFVFLSTDRKLWKYIFLHWRNSTDSRHPFIDPTSGALKIKVSAQARQRNFCVEFEFSQSKFLQN